MNKKNRCLEIEKECLSCGECVQNCVMLNKYVKNIKQLFSFFNNENTVNPIIPYSCLICGYCKTICPKQLNLGDGFMEMRKNLVLENNGAVPLKKLRSVEIHQKLSFSKFFTYGGK